MFTIVQDTREQAGWEFDMYQSNGIIRQKLDEGDYTLMELLKLEESTGRKILRIERKKSTGELATNLGAKWKTFCAELERLQVYEHKYIILEFSIDILMGFPEFSGIPKSKWYRTNSAGKRVKNIRMTGAYMIKKINEIRQTYGIEIIFAHTSAEHEAMSIFIKVYNANKEAIQGQ